MKFRGIVILCCTTLLLSACAEFYPQFCQPRCRSESRASTNLVEFLYPRGQMPPTENSIPQLNIPLRVGLAFLPAQQGETTEGLEASRRDELLQRIRQHFADRKFVAEIVVIPDYYLKTGDGFASLAALERLYNVDVVALVSYDQVMYRDQNAWSLGYLTILGAYVLKGNRDDVTTLVDLAVIDPASRSIVLRAGGTDTRREFTTLVDAEQRSRTARGDSFTNATEALIVNFDSALNQFEADVRAGKANIRVGHRGGSGAGSLDPLVLIAALALLTLRLRKRRTARRPLAQI